MRKGLHQPLNCPLLSVAGTGCVVSPAPPPVATAAAPREHPRLRAVTAATRLRAATARLRAATVATAATAITPAAAALTSLATAATAADVRVDVLPPPLVAYATVGGPLPGRIARTLQL